jgi:hypothetical protein
VGPKAFQWEGVIKIWTRGQNLAQKSMFSELPQNKWVCSPHHHEPQHNSFRLKQTSGVKDIAICSESQTGKNFDADCTSPYSLYNPYDLTWQDRMNVQK